MSSLKLENIRMMGNDKTDCNNNASLSPPHKDSISPYLGQMSISSYDEAK